MRDASAPTFKAKFDALRAHHQKLMVAAQMTCPASSLGLAVRVCRNAQRLAVATTRTCQPSSRMCARSDGMLAMQLLASKSVSKDEKLQLSSVMQFCKVLKQLATAYWQVCGSNRRALCYQRFVLPLLAPQPQLSTHDHLHHSLLHIHRCPCPAGTRIEGSFDNSSLVALAQLALDTNGAAQCHRFSMHKISENIKQECVDAGCSHLEVHPRHVPSSAVHDICSGASLVPCPAPQWSANSDC